MRGALRVPRPAPARPGGQGRPRRQRARRCADGSSTGSRRARRTSCAGTVAAATAASPATAPTSCASGRRAIAAPGSAASSSTTTSSRWSARTPTATSFGAPRSGGRVHEGQDLPSPCGTPLIAARGGRVQATGYSDALYGYYVLIDGLATRRDYFYAHMQAPTSALRGRAGAHRSSGSATSARPATPATSSASCTSSCGRTATTTGRPPIRLRPCAPGMPSPSASSLATVSQEIAAEETRRYGRSAGLLTLALGSAGLLAYAFFAVSSHTLDKRRLRDDRRPLVGELRRRRDPLPADRAAALADARRARRARRAQRARAADRGPDPGGRDAARGGRAPARCSRARSPSTCSTAATSSTGSGRRPRRASAAPTTPAASSPAGASSASTRPCSCSRAARA